MQGHRAVVTKPNVIEMQPFDVPDPGPTEVLIRTRATLVSPGTERAFFMALPNTNAAYPLIPGYSNIGEVIAVGADVDGVAVGDRVASGTHHASHVVAPAVSCVPVPAGLDDADATFFNLVAIAMQGVHKARIELGESVAVIGLGPIGLFALQLARINGGLPAVAIDQDAGRLALARDLGADVALPSDDALLGALPAHTGTDGAAVVVEATGASAAVVLSFRMAATRGRVILLGSARGETDGVNFYRDVHRKGLTIIGAHEITRPTRDESAGWWTQHHEQALALKLLALGRISAAPLINRRFGWADFGQAYDVLASWDRSVLGMVIDWTA